MSTGNPQNQQPAPEKKPKRKVGRPAYSVSRAIETGKLPENWKEIVMEKSAEGWCEAEIRAELMKSNGLKAASMMSIWYNLKDREIEFQEVLKSSRALAQAWWANKARTSLDNRFFQSAAWIFSVKNMFPDAYKDKTEIEHGVSDETFDKYAKLSARELTDRLKQLLPPKDESADRT